MIQLLIVFFFCKILYKYEGFFIEFEYFGSFPGSIHTQKLQVFNRYFNYKSELIQIRKEPTQIMHEHPGLQDVFSLV